MNTQRKFLELAAVTLLVAGCGGGGGGSDDGGGSGGAPNPPSSGGNGAARTMFVHGAITGFGSVIVNGVHYETEGATIEVEGRSGSDRDLRVGQVVSMEAEVDASGKSRAKSIVEDHLIQGVVQAVDAAAGTLTVAGQLVRVDAETMFDDSIPGRALSGIAVGDVVEVHGFAGADGARATRIEQKDADDDEVEVTGVVEGLDTAAKRFRIGTLVVDYSAATLDDFDGAAIADGQVVEVKGTTFLAGGALAATRIEREDNDFDGGPGDGSEVEGLVTRFVSATDFDVAGQKVTTTSSTVFVNGTAANLQLGVKVEAEGTLDASGTLVAAKVAFKRQSTARLAAQIDAINATAGTFTALGVTVVVDGNTTRLEDHEGDDHFFAFDDLRVGDWVEVRGFVDGSGRLVASRLERDDADDEVEVRGPATDVGPDGLKVLGVSVVLVSRTEFEDEDTEISKADFLAQAPGRIVEADGSWNGTSLTADEVEIEENDDDSGDDSSDDD